MTGDADDRRLTPGTVVAGPTLRQASLITLVGYILTFGTPFASFHALPKLLDITSAARTSENLQAHPTLFAAAILAMLASFTGDVFAAWGLYLLLRPVNAAWSMLTAWFRLVYAGAGVNALLNLVTAHRLLNQAGSAVALGRPAFDAKLQESLVSFQAGFDFSLILFGVYLTMVGGLMFRSGYVPRWLGIVIVVNGLGWALMEVGPYVLPGVNLGFLFVTTLGELVLVIWLVGWGLRLKGPERSARLR